MINKHFADQGGELVGTGYAHSGMAPTPANPLFWEIGIGAVEVSVDRETGKVHVEKYVTAADAGKAIHPLQCEGQDEGAAMMGFGHTFYEAYQWEGGQIINSSLVDYKVPTFDDVPGRIRVDSHRRRQRAGTLRRQGFGRRRHHSGRARCGECGILVHRRASEVAAADTGKNLAGDQADAGKIKGTIARPKPKTLCEFSSIRMTAIVPHYTARVHCQYL